MFGGLTVRHGLGMADHRPPERIAVRHPGVPMTREEFDALVDELDSLRDRHRVELAHRLRDARADGSSGENDDLLTASEEAAINDARIGRLEYLVRAASVVETKVFDGRADLGCIVRVADERGRVAEYSLIGRRHSDSASHAVSLASPLGRALLGASPGDVIDVALPNGGERRVRVLDVTPATLDERGDGLRRPAKAA
jgi:transcription elongation factor GreA